MNFPPRLAHLATRAVVVAKLTPVYGPSHNLDDDEAARRLDAALRGGLLDELLASAWEAMVGTAKRLDEAGLLEKVAQTLHDRPTRPGRKAAESSAWSAFFLKVDLAAGVASETAMRILETEQGKKVAAEGLKEAGRYLAAELTRGR
ncbi:MAG: hypothetical protein ACYC8T_34415 [Myxococcaceae bacterium]